MDDQTAGTPAVAVPTQAKRPANKEKLAALATRLMGSFKTYESHRVLQELKWERNLRQFLGEYDPDVKKSLEANRSQAYPRLTRVKCVSMLARLMNLLFPTSEKNWGIEASPVPNLEATDLQMALDAAMQTAQQHGGQLTDEIIEQAVRAFAKQRAENLSKEVEDQLAEIGGNRSLGYVQLCRKVLLSGIMYGVGTVKGPMVRKQTIRTWSKNAAGEYEPHEIEVMRPQFEFVPVWDYYPDLTAKTFAQMDGQYHRYVFNKAQLRELADRPDFFGDEIKSYLESHPKGNWKERRHETSLRTQGEQANVNVLSSNKYEVIVWDGYVATNDLKECGIELPEQKLADMADASVWMLDGRVIKCVLSPWVELEPDERVQMYHHFVFEEDDTSLVGNGLPNIMRDSQMMVSAATRMAMDNGSVACAPNAEVNVDLLRADQDASSIEPYKVWYREGTGQEAALPAVREIKFDSHITELKELITLGETFADAETFVNPATGGDMQKGPSEPFRTAAGASMIQGQAALPFKDVVRNYDSFTISVINAIVLFNKHFNPNREVQGDHTVIARGASSLIAKEIRGMALDQLAQTVQPEERKYLNWYALLKERLATRDVDVTGVVLSADDAKAADAAEAAAAQADKEQMQELLKAEVRKLLADAVKSLTAADANAANADLKQAQGEVAKYQTILEGLEKGVTPADVHASHATGELPPEMSRRVEHTEKTEAKVAAKPPASGGSK